MEWTQNYDPLGSPWLSTAVAALPIVLLLGSLGLLGWSAPKAAALGLASALAVAIFAYGMPWHMALASAVYGAAFGLFPIGWIVLAAIFLYSLTVETGQFEIVKYSVMSLSDDRRIQALLIAFCFGAFIEGAAGFGTPVAISAALMMGAGFRPLHAAGLALIANTSPVAFGALGTPVLTLADVSLPAGMRLEAWELQLSRMAGRQLPFFSLLVPAWLVWVMAGWRGVVGVWPALLVCGGSFAAVQFLVANFVGPELVDVAGGLVSLVSLTLFLRVWQPRRTWHFADEPPRQEPPTYTRPQIASAWMPWVFLTLFVFAWGLPQMKEALKPTTLPVEVPGLHGRIVRGEEVAGRGERKAEAAVYEVNWLAATGTSIFLAAVVSAWWLGVRPGRVLFLPGGGVARPGRPPVTIACL